MKKIDITYVFGTGRIDKINEPGFSNEFFYGYDYFSKKKLSLKIIELNEKSKVSNFNGKFFHFIDRILNKLSKLPFYSSEVTSYKNFKILLNSTNVIFSNDRIGLSSLFIFSIARLFKKINTVVIVMGMLNNDGEGRAVVFCRRIILNFFLSINNSFIFLGEGEWRNASIQFPKFAHKFVFLPFCIDTNFWKSEIKYLPEKREHILFIGNDGNREYEKVIKIAKNLPGVKFLFVTSNIKDSDIISDNVELIRGNWNKSILNDDAIKEIYMSSLMTIIPLKNTLQPSGQSVALQSMSMGTPVLISNSIGFWDKEKFINEEHLLILEDNSIENWIKKINDLLAKADRLQSMSSKGQSLIQEKYKLDYFDLELEKFLKEVN